MSVMAETQEHAQELIEAPLSRQELAVRYRDLCADPSYNRVPGKIEIDLWGRLVMTPPSFYHGRVQGRVIQALGAIAAGEVMGETPIATAAGLFVADATWASDAFVHAHIGEVVLGKAPDICVEVVSPSNSRKEIDEKTAAYLAAGAQEVWLIYLKSERCEFFGPQGRLDRSGFPVDLSQLFK
jgi:Uma2 family endonuclease